MEPRGCNWRQPVADRTVLKSAGTSENRCRGLRPVAAEIMVRRGSTVGVRQRAFGQKSCKKSCIVVCPEHNSIRAGTRRVQIPGLAGTRGHARPCASSSDTSQPGGSEQSAMEIPASAHLSLSTWARRRPPPWRGGGQAVS